MADEVQLTGMAELRATLERLPGHLGEKVIRAALRAGAQVIRKDAQSRAPELQEPDPRRKRGTLKKNITVRRSKTDKYGVFVGVKPLSKKQIATFKKAGGKKGANNPDDPFYWWFVEFGTSKMPATRFLREAFESQKFAALRRFEEFSKRRMVKEANKLAQQLGGRAA